MAMRTKAAITHKSTFKNIHDLSNLCGHEHMKLDFAVNRIWTVPVQEDE